MTGQYTFTTCNLVRKSIETAYRFRPPLLIY